MKFKNLPIGKPFQFTNHSGEPNGPWMKLSETTYFRPIDVFRQQDFNRIYNLPSKRFSPHRVGSINVEVIETTLQGEELEDFQRAQQLISK